MRVSIGRACAAVALLVFSAAPAPAQWQDTPLSRFDQRSGPGYHVAVAGLGTANGASTITIDVPGDPVAAWIYWSGEIFTGGHPSPTVTLGGGGGLAGPIVLPLLSVPPEEVGRRLPLAEDGFGGEVVMRASVPPSAFIRGTNTFTIDPINTTDPNGPPAPPGQGDGNAPYYFRQYGVAMIVLYPSPNPSGTRELISLHGADVANYFRAFFEAPATPAEANSNVICFDFAPLACGRFAKLSIGVGGVLDVTAPPAVGVVSGERTWFQHGAGPKPASLVGTATVLEDDQLDRPPLHRGERLAIFDREVALGASDTWACFQHEMKPFVDGQYVAQNFTTHLAALEIDRACSTGCLTKGPGFWSKHPEIAALYLPATSCGLALDSTAAGTGSSVLEDLCFNGGDARTASTSTQQLMLVRQCTAAQLNLAATRAGGGDCSTWKAEDQERDDTSALNIVQRITDCCETTCPSGMSGPRLDKTGCIEDLREFNRSKSTMSPFGPFVSPGHGDKNLCRAAKGNGFVNRTDATGHTRTYGPKGKSKECDSDDDDD